MYVPDLKSDTDRLSDAIDLLRGHRYRILNNQSLEASKSMGINWIAGLDKLDSSISFTSLIAERISKLYEFVEPSTNTIISNSLKCIFIYEKSDTKLKQRLIVSTYHSVVTKQQFVSRILFEHEIF